MGTSDTFQYDNGDCGKEPGNLHSDGKTIDKGAHYRFEYKGIKLDPARIFKIYGVANPLQMAIVKKGLVTGARGKKSLIEDIDDIITACLRWKEMIEEDS